jgi:hypothetical protein
VLLAREGVAQLGLGRLHRRGLSDPQVVSEGVADAHVDPVRALHRLLRDVDVLRGELLVRPAAVAVVKTTEPATPLVTCSRTSSAVASSIDGGPGRSSRSCRPRSPGTLTVSQRMKPMSASVWTSRPSLPT